MEVPIKCFLFLFLFAHEIDFIFEELLETSKIVLLIGIFFDGPIGIGYENNGMITIFNLYCRQKSHIQPFY